MNAFRTSLIILNYNYGHFLEDAVNSALDQEQPFYEIIVVDDGSTDNSRTLIDFFPQNILKIFKENGGQGSAMNAGFDRAQGEWVWFIDADDYLFPGSLRKVQAKYSNEIGWIYGQLQRVSRDKKNIGLCLPSTLPEGDLFPALAKHGTRRLSPTSGLVFRRDALKKHMPVPDFFRANADDYLRISMAVSTPVASIPDPIAAFRSHETSEQSLVKHSIVGIKNFLARSSVAFEKVAQEAVRRGWSPVPRRNRIDSHFSLCELIVYADSHPLISRGFANRIRLGRSALHTTWVDSNITFLRRIQRSIHILAITATPSFLVKHLNTWILSTGRNTKTLVKKIGLIKRP